MNLKGEEVTHVRFGAGVVADLQENIITVIFAKQGEKQFLFPAAFSSFLTFQNPEVQQYAEDLLNGINREKELHRQAEQKEHARMKALRRLKVSPNSQAMFGFVENKKNDVFASWTVSAGHYAGGCSKGEPRIPVRLKPNSACLLTECPAGAQEADRRILGLFMVREDFDGALCADGIIPGHSRYRLELKDSETLPYWRYFEYAGSQPPKWGKTEMKYCSNRIVQQILQDVCGMVRDPGQAGTAAEFYRYFCAVNHLENALEKNA